MVQNKRNVYQCVHWNGCKCGRLKRLIFDDYFFRGDHFVCPQFYYEVEYPVPWKSLHLTELFIRVHWREQRRFYYVGLMQEPLWVRFRLWRNSRDCFVLCSVPSSESLKLFQRRRSQSNLCVATRSICTVRAASLKASHSHSDERASLLRKVTGEETVHVLMFNRARDAMTRAPRENCREPALVARLAHF